MKGQVLMKLGCTWILAISSLGYVGLQPELMSAGTVTESGSDALSASYWSISPTPDLISASATFDTAYLYLSVRITPSFPIIDPSTKRGITHINFYLDTDQNPATGNTSTCSGSCDVGILGWERAVYFNTSSFTSAQLSGGGTFPATFQADGFGTRIPLTSLGDDGLLNFKVLDYVDLGPSSFTGILDVLPNWGLAASTSSLVPEPAWLSLLSVFAVGSYFHYSAHSTRIRS